MGAGLEQAAAALRLMQAAGVRLDPDVEPVEDDFAQLITDDPAVAEQFGFGELGDEDGEESEED